METGGIPTDLTWNSPRTGNAVGTDHVGFLLADGHLNGMSIGAQAPISYPETFPDPGY